VPFLSPEGAKIMAFFIQSSILDNGFVIARLGDAYRIQILFVPAAKAHLSHSSFMQSIAKTVITTYIRSGESK